MPQESRLRSESHELDDSDSDGDQPSRPGRKKNANSQAARRDQNRIAQREFRLRKQQRIRDLEARVEILSGGKDEAMGEMRLILKDLMQENQTLRNLLRSLSNFIGEGAGGLLPKLGWDPSDFNNFLNRSETDTAWEGYQQRKKTNPTNGTAAAAGLKRPNDDESGTSSSKKKQKSQDGPDPQNDYSLLMPINSMSSDLYANRSYDAGPFSNMLRAGPSSASPLFMQNSPPGTATASSFAATPPGNNGAGPGPAPNFDEPYISTLALTNAAASVPPFQSSSQSATTVASTAPSSSTTVATVEDDDSEDSSKGEAYKLIHYHLDNYKRNTAYCLPSSLRPTLVQRTIPHESVIDRILHPELRDRMILLRGRFDLVDCLLDYRNAVTIHGDDVLNHANWEISEKWLRQYGFLIDQPTLNVTNRWRRDRGESELRLADVVPPEGTPTAST